MDGWYGMEWNVFVPGSECSSTSTSSIHAPGPMLLGFIVFTRTLRRLFLRYLSLPRPSFLAVKPIQNKSNPNTKMYHFERKGLQPWYVKPTFWSIWGPQALLLRAFGGKVVGSRGDRYKPQGYDLWTVGPEPQNGKGLEEMKPDVETIMARSLTTCPFSHARHA